MKYFDWSELKNAQLKAERGVGFEDVLSAIDEGRVLENVSHPNEIRYPHQKLLVVEVHDYVYLVPYVEDEIKIFFKTIIPSRKATRKYKEGDDDGPKL